ncbi:hypothetical protein ARMGADRAFT_1026497 [Armillaria gallica]|uniref:F-box domain-containing protein n=1 Tax=Armillaria gallica TaxID=47427 RepID=A0A2H3EAW5_ARMGA|nr:hypothetical protein ARMGADRAFT_1026497 [Armillaria gallica]
MSPITRLPTETLTDIFLATCEDTLEVGDPSAVPMVIIQVLERSHNRTLHIQFGAGEQGGLLPVSLKVLAILATQSHRWGHLELSCSPSHLALLDVIRDRIPVLVHLSIDLVHSDSVDFGHIDAFASAPQLKRVQFVGFYGAQIPLVPYNQLTDFVDIRLYANLSIHNQYLAILQQAQHIQNFIARYTVDGPSIVTAPNPPILCDSICAFTASEGALFRSVVLPNLERVSVDPGWAPYLHEGPVIADLEAVPALLSMITKSQCQTTLTHILMEDTLLTEDLIGIARLAPALDEWRFSWTEWSRSNHGPLEQLIKGLAEQTTTDEGKATFNLLPVLTGLHISIHDLDDIVAVYFVGEILASTMEARLGAMGTSGRPFGVTVECSLFYIQRRLLVCREAGHLCSITLSGRDVLEDEDSYFD